MQLHDLLDGRRKVREFVLSEKWQPFVDMFPRELGGGMDFGCMCLLRVCEYVGKLGQSQ